LPDICVAPADQTVKAIVSPTLPQAKVNKCLIALVAKKLVTKTSIGVRIPVVLYDLADLDRERRSTYGRPDAKATLVLSALPRGIPVPDVMLCGHLDPEYGPASQLEQFEKGCADHVTL